MDWERPIGDFPRKWHHFKAKDTNSDELVNYVVQDVPENRFEEVVQFMLKHFLPDEPLCVGAGVPNDPISCKENAALWLKILRQKMSIICFKEGCNDIVGVNILHVTEATHKGLDLDVKGAAFKIVYGVYLHVSHQFDPFQFHQVDTYLSAVGLTVHSDFRRRGIAVEILKARVPLCKAFGIKATSTMFTGIGSQMSAAKAGFIERYSIDYADLSKINADYKFADVKSKSIKMMSLEIL